MPQITKEITGSQNLCSFLDTIAHAEGTSSSKRTKNDGYDVIVGGVDSPNIFTDYSKHPGILVTVNKNGLKSTAAGRYQLLSRYYSPYATLLKLKDFSPISQDLIAIQQIRERKAYGDIVAGNFDVAMAKISNIWASLPNSPYGQRTSHSYSLDYLRNFYQKMGGKLA